MPLRWVETITTSQHHAASVTTTATTKKRCMIAFKHDKDTRTILERPAVGPMSLERAPAVGYRLQPRADIDIAAMEPSRCHNTRPMIALPACPTRLSPTRPSVVASPLYPRRPRLTPITLTTLTPSPPCHPHHPPFKPPSLSLSQQPGKSQPFHHKAMSYRSLVGAEQPWHWWWWWRDQGLRFSTAAQRDYITTLPIIMALSR
ncbi:hypothetical protein EDC01DRAFT_515974 [Geopyxis carbonaria]|nr:hypothetical protein EDC01DRAFT_515974 [Geopyxis carbonaria]